MRLFRNSLGNDSRRLKAAACGCTIYKYKTLKREVVGVCKLEI
jgi:hypothetical protein